MMKKIQKVCLRTAGLIGLLIFLVLTGCSFCWTKTLLAEEMLENNRDPVWIWLFLVGAVFLLAAGAVKSEKYLSKKMLHIMAILLSGAGIIFGAVLCRSVRAYAVADQWYVYDAAVRLYNGTFNGSDYAGYYLSCPYQLSLAQLYELVFRLVGDDSYVILQTFHSICGSITFYVGFHIVRTLTRRRAAEGLYLIMGICFLPLYMYCLYIYGESLGLCCAMTIIWCFLKMNEDREPVPAMACRGVLGAVAIALICQVRAALIIVGIALLLIQIMVVMGRKKLLPFLTLLLMFVAAFGLCSITNTFLERRTGVSMKEKIPYCLYIAMGLQENADSAKGPGSFNGYNWNVYAMTGRDAQASEEIGKDMIQSRLMELIGNPKEGAKFFGRKIINQWNEPTYGCFVMTGFYEDGAEWVKSLYQGEGNKFWLRFLNGYQAVVYLAVFLGFARLAVRERTPEEYLIGVVLIGEFLFSLIWEAKSRYVYPYAVIMIPFAACSLMHCGEAVVNKLKNKKR